MGLPQNYSEFTEYYTKKQYNDAICSFCKNKKIVYWFVDIYKNTEDNMNNPLFLYKLTKNISGPGINRISTIFYALCINRNNEFSDDIMQKYTEDRNICLLLFSIVDKHKIPLVFKYFNLYNRFDIKDILRHKVYHSKHREFTDDIGRDTLDSVIYKLISIDDIDQCSRFIKLIDLCDTLDKNNMFPNHVYFDTTIHDIANTTKYYMYSLAMKICTNKHVVFDVLKKISIEKRDIDDVFHDGVLDKHIYKYILGLLGYTGGCVSCFAVKSRLYISVKMLRKTIHKHICRSGYKCDEFIGIIRDYIYNKIDHVDFTCAYKLHCLPIPLYDFDVLYRCALRLHKLQKPPLDIKTIKRCMIYKTELIKLKYT